MNYRIAVLPGDGIGPEVTREAVRVLEAVAEATGVRFTFVEASIGGTAVDATGDPFPPETEALCLESDAILLGAVGGPRWDREPATRRPEAGLLRLRKAVGAFANLRPVRLHPRLAGRGPLRPEVVGAGVDVLIVRELTGGLYYGERGREHGPGGERAYDTMVYTAAEIERIVRMAFRLARQRRGRVTSVDKSNVLETSRLWRQVTEAVAAEFPDVEVDHLYVDNAAMQLVRDPGRFDVLVTENTFGDILSDLGAALAGSIGLLPSASLGTGERPPLFEPVHGSAPDIAGRGIANPIGAIASAAMLLRHACGLEREARAVERAIDEVLAEGPLTPDLAAPGSEPAGTEDVGRAIARRVRELLAPAPLEAAGSRHDGEAGDVLAVSWIADAYGFRPVVPEGGIGVAPAAGATGTAGGREGASGGAGAAGTAGDTPIVNATPVGRPGGTEGAGDAAKAGDAPPAQPAARAEPDRATTRRAGSRRVRVRKGA